MAEDYLGFVGAIIGGAISGVVGIFIARYSNNLQDKDRLKDNVYRKLYGFIFDMCKRDKPLDYSVSMDAWSRIEPYELIKMDKKMRADFEKLYSDMSRWNAFSTGLASNYMQRQTDIQKVLREAFGQRGLLNENGNITADNSSYSVDGFVQPYLLMIMNPEIKDSETLYRNMFEYALQNFSYRKEIPYMKEHNPIFFDVLLQQLPVLRSICLQDFNYAEMMKLRVTIMDNIRALKGPLEKLTK
jgi:hypothetical protein